jgi:hypothetical protein
MNGRSTRRKEVVLGVEHLESRELLNGHRLSLHSADVHRAHAAKLDRTAALVTQFDVTSSVVAANRDVQRNTGTIAARLSTGQARRPIFDPENFGSVIDNPYFPLVPGTTFLYLGTDEGHPLRDEYVVTNDTKQILGVTTTVIRDRAFVDDELVEETLDWFAQDNDGNVWYFGEDSKVIENGVVVSTEGSWEAGADGARPGIVMEAHPRRGDAYQQEFAKEVAEDRAKVLSLKERVTVPYGSFDNCLKTKDFSRLDPGVAEHKYYASGVGFIRSVKVKGGSEVLELVSVTTE